MDTEEMDEANNEKEHQTFNAKWAWFIIGKGIADFHNVTFEQAFNLDLYMFMNTWAYNFEHANEESAKLESYKLQNKLV